MRFYDWLNKYRHPRDVARENIRTRRLEYAGFRGRIIASEVLEARCVLAAPTASDGSASLHMNSMLMTSVSTADADMDWLTVSLVGATTSHGLLTLNPDGSLYYTPNASDGESVSNVATYTITVENAAPSAFSGSGSVDQDSMLMSSVTASDPDLDWLTVSLVGATTANGSLNLNNDGSFVYTPNAGYSGTDSFTFQASDGHANSNVASFSITGRSRISNATRLNKGDVEEKIAGKFSLGAFWKCPLGMESQRCVLRFDLTSVFG